MDVQCSVRSSALQLTLLFPNHCCNNLYLVYPQNWITKLEKHLHDQQEAMQKLHTDMDGKDRSIAELNQRTVELGDTHTRLQQEYAQQWHEEHGSYEQQIADLRQRIADMQRKFNGLASFADVKVWSGTLITHPFARAHTHARACADVAYTLGL